MFNFCPKKVKKKNPYNNYLIIVKKNKYRIFFCQATKSMSKIATIFKPKIKKRNVLNLCKKITQRSKKRKMNKTYNV